MSRKIKDEDGAAMKTYEIEQNYDNNGYKTKQDKDGATMKTSEVEINCNNNGSRSKFKVKGVPKKLGETPLTALMASGNQWELVPVAELQNTNNDNASEYTARPETMGMGKGVYLETRHIDFLMCMAFSGQSQHEIRSRCEAALLAADVNNVTESYLIAAKYGLQRVMDALIRVIRDNFIAVTQTRQFLELPVDLVELFLSDTFVNVADELDVFSIALRWIDYNKQERLCLAGRILNCVRYEKIRPIDIRDHIEPNIHLFNGPCGPETLVNIYRSHALAYSAVHDGGGPLGPRASGNPANFPGKLPNRLTSQPLPGVAAKESTLSQVGRTKSRPVLPVVPEAKDSTTSQVGRKTSNPVVTETEKSTASQSDKKKDKKSKEGKKNKKSKDKDKEDKDGKEGKKSKKKKSTKNELKQSSSAVSFAENNSSSKRNRSASSSAGRRNRSIGNADSRRNPLHGSYVLQRGSSDGYEIHEPRRRRSRSSRKYGSSCSDMRRMDLTARGRSISQGKRVAFRRHGTIYYRRDSEQTGRPAHSLEQDVSYRDRLPSMPRGNLIPHAQARPREV